MKPCQHATRQPDCRICELAATRADYARLWGEPEPVGGGRGSRPAGGPGGTRPLPCIHEGAVLEWCQTCAGDRGHVRDCSHPNNPDERCTRGDRRKKVRCCADCPDYQADPAAAMVVIDQGGNGVGDALQGLLALPRDRPVHYRVSASARPWVELFDGYAALSLHAKDHNEHPTPDGAVQLNLGYRDELRTRGAVSRAERYRRNGGAAGLTVPSLREPDRVRAAGADLAGAVLLAPFSHFRDREPPLHLWLEIERRLIAAGYRVVVLHYQPARTERFAGEKLIGQAPERVAGAALNAACVVGCDSGMPHLAGILGTPAVVLCGPTKGEPVFGCYKTVRWVSGPLACAGCYWQAGGGRTSECERACAVLAAVPPGDVLRAVDAAVLPGLTGGRSLLDAGRLAGIRDALRLTAHLPGVLAEVGVYRGGSARLIGTLAPGVPLHLFDTFAGIPEDDQVEGGHARGDFADTSAEAVRAFVDNPAAVFHVGTFPGTAPIARGPRFRFVHIDADTFQSTRDAIAYFRPRMIPGGVILFDDYGWEGCPGVALACREAGLSIEKTAEYQARVRF